MSYQSVKKRAKMLDYYEKVRKHAQLESQKSFHALLTAIEASIEERKLAKTPAAYFASLMMVLSTIDQESQHDEQVAAAYLLSLVMPHVPQTLLKHKCDDCYSVLVPLVQDDQDDASVLVRYAMESLAYVVLAQSPEQWSSQATIGAYQAILVKTLVGGNAKIRKLA